jgi:hypothetical protein
LQHEPRPSSSASVDVVLSYPPSAFTVPMMATAIRAASKPSSIAVAPDYCPLLPDSGCAAIHQATPALYHCRHWLSSANRAQRPSLRGWTEKIWDGVA